MLHIETIRNNPKTVEKQLNSKGETIAISEILNIDTLYRKQMSEVNDLRALRNKVSDEIAEAKRAGDDSDDAIQAMLAGSTPTISSTESIGCSVKWKM